MIVLLDSGVLSLLCTPINDTSESEDNEIKECSKWFYSLLSKGVNVFTSEIADYEVRREYLRIKSQGLQELDKLREIIEFLPLTEEVMKKAAEFWAIARQNNIPTADNQNIDADMIISAQWSLLQQDYPGQAVFIATTNVKHLKIFAQNQAQEWQNIKF